MTGGLGGELVDLVPVTRELAEALLTGRDPGLPLAPGYPHADTADAMRAFVTGGGAEPGTFLIVRRSDGRVVGDCGTFGAADSHGTVEIGYGLAPSARGRGLATDAVRVLLAWVRDRPGARTVEADVDLDNAASRALLDRLGFSLGSVGPRQVRYVLTWAAPEGRTPARP
jgi:RimJ/RimL family protein N-acetyltransferase